MITNFIYMLNSILGEEAQEEQPPPPPPPPQDDDDMDLDFEEDNNHFRKRKRNDNVETPSSSSSSSSAAGSSKNCPPAPPTQAPHSSPTSFYNATRVVYLIAAWLSNFGNNGSSIGLHAEEVKRIGLKCTKLLNVLLCLIQAPLLSSTCEESIMTSQHTQQVDQFAMMGGGGAESSSLGV